MVFLSYAREKGTMGMTDRMRVKKLLETGLILLVLACMGAWLVC